MATKYRLRITKLEFISAVDRPAQETAVAAIIKRRDDVDDITATFRVAKVDDSLGIVFGWALTSQLDGSAYHDLQGDHVSEDELVKAAAEYAMEGGHVDEQHSEVPGAGQAIFLFPLTQEIGKALGIPTRTTGLLAGIKCAPDVLAKFRSGAYSGFSIGGRGERELVKHADDFADESDTDHDVSPEELKKNNEAIVKSMLAHCDYLAEEHGIDEALECAERNRDSIGKWGQRWIDEHLPQIMKAEQSADDPEVALEKAQDALDAYVAHIAKRRGIDADEVEGQLGMEDDETYAKLYSDLDDATSAVASPAADFDEDVDKRMSSDAPMLQDDPDRDVLAAQQRVTDYIERFAMQHALEMRDAERTLERLRLPQYLALKAAFEQSYNEAYATPR